MTTTIGRPRRKARTSRSPGLRVGDETFDPLTSSSTATEPRLARTLSVVGDCNTRSVTINYDHRAGLHPVSMITAALAMCAGKSTAPSTPGLFGASHDCRRKHESYSVDIGSGQQSRMYGIGTAPERDSRSFNSHRHQVWGECQV